MPKRILLTPGEPAGIGPELTVKIAQQAQSVELCAIADPQLLADTAKRLALPLTIRTIDKAEQTPSVTEAGHIACLPVTLAAEVQAGQLDVRNAHYVLETLKQANQICMNDLAVAVVTGPVHKGIINEAGIAFSGHTEFFAQQSQTEKVVMLLAAGDFRVALATTHLPLKDVPQAITREGLTEVIHILHSELKSKFGLKQPRILVCGLNPHAGEDGHLGMEEIDTIIPTLETLRAEGIQLIGPLPADTLFTPRHLDDADAVLAMYHDQGLPVLKHAGFGRAVNITLGLPYIRTSVDHGTALNLAGQGIAEHQSLQCALDEALSLAQNNK